MTTKTSCFLCNDTGSQSRNLEGHLDCSCEITDRRVALNKWYSEVRNDYDPPELLWLAYLRGKNEATK